VIPQFYRGSEGALAVFDLTKPASFDHITNWIEEVHRHTPADLPIVLVGNKSDLIDQRKVSRDQATALAQNLNIAYMETSALNASNVEQAFTTLVTNIYHKKIPKAMDNSSSITSSTVSKIAEQETTSTGPVSSDGQIEIGINRKSFHLKNNPEPMSPKKNGCC
jgi:Ras-related protein Rab-11A